MEIKTLVDKEYIESVVQDIFSKHGPDCEDFEKVLDFVNSISSDEVAAFRESMQPILNPGTIIGFSYTKPFGYNGDFFIIEKIYQQYVNPDPKYKKWDEFFHRLPAAIAVINRKKLAIEILMKLNEQADGSPKKVLILGSGPVTEINEYFKQVTANSLFFDLLDLDQRAIDYAKNKNKPYLQYLNFQNKNVIRYVPSDNYDLIWSAGLFDYFKDKHFVYLVKKFYESLKPGAELIIGNFNVENPSRKIMEILGDWFLYHRSEEDLVSFAKQAGIPPSQVEVMKEPLGINLFLKTVK